MKKTAVFLLAFSLACGAFAYEYGGTLGESVEFLTNDFDPVAMEEKTELTLFFRTAFSPSSYLVAEASAAPTFRAEDLTEIDDGEFETPLDILLLKYDQSIAVGTSSSLNFAVGRFPVADSSGIVLNQVSDGAYAAYNSQRVVASLYAGYTGLLNGINAPMVNSDVDETNDFYYGASPFLLGQATVYFPYLFLNQSLCVEGLCAIGMNGPNGDNSDYNRFYGTVSLSGPLGERKFYFISSTFEAQKEDEEFDSISNLTQLAFTYFIPEYYGSQVTARALYASGENGSLSAFNGISSLEATYAYSGPEYTGLIIAGLSGSIKPLPNMLASLGTDVVFTYLEDEIEYDGVQVYGSLAYQLYTDLQLGLSAHQYIGNESEENETSLTLSVRVAF